MRNPFEIEEHQAFRDAVLDFVEREIRPYAIGGGSEEIMRDLAVRQMGL